MSLVRGGLLIALTGCEPRAERVFEHDVAPVLARSCGSDLCHGVPPDSPQPDSERFAFPVGSDGNIVDFASARTATLRAITTDEPPEFSTLLRKSVPMAYGGLAHFGGSPFPSPEVEGYRAIEEWIALEVSGGEDVEPLDALEMQFAEDVQPFLANSGCMSAACHGPSAAVPYRLDPGIGGEFSDAMTRANREASVTMLAFAGDPLQSRLIRKSLPLHEGGIVHKGGNRSFLYGLDDDRLDPLRDWACAEREARLGHGCTDGAMPISGFVYVAGPVQAEDPFTLDAFVPGSDLYLATVADETLVPAAIENLTANLHDEPADIRDPAVDPDGRFVAFAMRTGEDSGHELWVLDLVTREATQVTSGTGPVAGGGFATDREPTWGPGGELWFVSTRSGLVAHAGNRLDADLYAVDLNSGELTRRSFTPHIERKPVFYTIGHEARGEVAFTSLRDVVPDQAVAHVFRFPPGLETEYHQHFGITPPEDLFTDMRELADGRYVVVIGDLDNVWALGRLGVVDRNFGPEIGPDDDPNPSLPVYAAPLVRLDESATAEGTTSIGYRDPVGLPDGRILAATAPGPIDLGDHDASVELRIEVIALEEAPDGSGPQIESRAVLLAEPGLSVFDPEPVFAREPVPSTEQTWDPQAATGLLRHQGFPVIDALLGNLAPSGVKSPTEGIVAVRVVEAVSQTPEQRWSVPPEETLFGVTTATTTGIGPHGPARILVEAVLEEDGSFQLDLPANIAFRLQGVTEKGMASGTMHNRWYDLHPGQTIQQGVAPDVYPTTCGLCHGSMDGDPTEVVIDPDILTTASITLARYDQGNPHAPIVAPVCDPDDAWTVDYLTDIRPVLDAACVSCHSGASPDADLDLDDEPTIWFDVGYENLLAPGEGSGDWAYVDASTGSARRSYLLEKLLGYELDAPRELDVAGAHAGLTDEEIRVIAVWIDLGAPFSMSEAP